MAGKKKRGQKETPATPLPSARTTRVRAKDVGGAPLKFTPALAEMICTSIAAGMSMEQICEGAGMPDVGTVRRWLRRKEPEFVEFQAQHAAARVEAGDAVGLDVVEIARKLKEVAGKVARGEMPADIARAVVDALRAAADQLKWVAARMNRAKWGDKVDVEASGEVGLTMKMYAHEAKDAVEAV